MLLACGFVTIKRIHQPRSQGPRHWGRVGEDPGNEVDESTCKPIYRRKKKIEMLLAGVGR